MSFLDNVSSQEISKIRGFATLPDEYDRAGWADVARNCEFILNEQVSTRRGFGQAFDPFDDSGIRAMVFWFKAGVPYLVYANASSGVFARNLVTGGGNLTAYPGSVDLVDLCAFGPYVAIATGNSAFNTFNQLQLWAGDATIPHVAFTAPPVFGFSSITEPNTGTVSAGDHYFAVVFTTISGYETRPAPLHTPFGSSGSFADLNPQVFTATGGKTLHVEISPSGTWSPVYASAVLLMTPVINPGRFFFVPMDPVPVPVGLSTPIVFPDIDLSDVVLSATASREAITPTRNYFSLYSVDSSGNGPITPFKTLAYSERAVYFTRLADGTCAVFISEQNAREWITAAFHLKQLPDREEITTGFVLRGSLYLLGPNWTYVLSDNNGQPGSWTPAQQVDGRIGTTKIRGVDANSSLGYAWVAHTTGLYLFTQGFYAARPVTYLIQSVWDTIDWTTKNAELIVKDFPDRKIVMVFARLGVGLAAYDGVFVIDYTNGTNWDQVNCSMWSIFGGDSNQQGGVTIGAAELVINPDTNITELLLGLRGSGPFLRSKSEAAHDIDLHADGDFGNTLRGIAWEYRGCALPKVFREPQNYVAVSPRIRGNGTLGAVASTLDHKYTQDLTPITAQAAPGEWPLDLMDIQNETVHIEIDNYDENGMPVPDTYGIIAGWKIWWTGWQQFR